MTLKDRVLATLAYSDIFDYPLTFDEIFQNLIFKKTSKASLERILDQLLKKRKILKFGQFYQLKRPLNLAKKRNLYAKFAAKKLKRAKSAAKILSFIPTVKLIGVSGAVAVENTSANDDIDFFVITSKNLLWTTRFFCNLFLDIFGLRRRPGDKKITDKICLNMFVAEDALKLSPTDIYLAHEILQMKPVFVRGNTYQKFIQNNDWVFKFLPNWATDVKRQTTNHKRKYHKKALVVKPLATVCENFLKNFQLKLMSARRTTEKISDTKLFFHPEDVHYKVLTEFARRLKKLKIPYGKEVL